MIYDSNIGRKAQYWRQRALKACPQCPSSWCQQVFFDSSITSFLSISVGLYPPPSSKPASRKTRRSTIVHAQGFQNSQRGLRKAVTSKYALNVSLAVTFPWPLMRGQSNGSQSSMSCMRVVRQLLRNRRPANLLLRYEQLRRVCALE